MGLPNIIINFKKTSQTAVRRFGNGSVLILSTSESEEQSLKLMSADEIPNTLSDDNKSHIMRAFVGADNTPKCVYFINSVDIDSALKVAESIDFDYLAPPHNVLEEDVLKIAAFVKLMRNKKNRKVKAVLPNCSADSEGIINFTTTGIVTKDGEVTTAEFTARIAGLLAGTSLDVSATYKELSEVISVERLSADELNERIDGGEFLLFADFDKVKVARAVNSLTTYTEEKSEDYKYIKTIEIIDLIFKDIRQMCADDYIGKYANNYDNKCTLITAITVYLQELAKRNVIEDDITVSINMDLQIEYLKAHGIDVSEMSDTQIKMANTGTVVFLEAKIKLLNAIEDIAINFYI